MFARLKKTYREWRDAYRAARYMRQICHEEIPNEIFFKGMFADDAVEARRKLHGATAQLLRDLDANVSDQYILYASMRRVAARCVAIRTLWYEQHPEEATNAKMEIDIPWEVPRRRDAASRSRV